MELLPLPSPDVNTWIYSGATTLPFLATRKSYLAFVVPSRIKAIRTRLTLHRPRVAVFLGLSYLPYWSAIVGKQLRANVGEEFVIDRTPDGTYVVIKHPTARGVTNALYRRIGELLDGQ